MTAALTPALTLDYLHALSADLRAAVVLDARGECLAGPPALGDAARAVLAEIAGEGGAVAPAAGGEVAPATEGEIAPAAGGEVAPAAGGQVEPGAGTEPVSRPGGEPTGAATFLEGATEGGSVFAACDDRHAIVAVTGPHALSGLSLHDLRSALAALGGVNPVDGPPGRLSHAAVSALLGAADDHFRRPRAV